MLVVDLRHRWNFAAKPTLAVSSVGVVVSQMVLAPGFFGMEKRR